MVHITNNKNITKSVKIDVNIEDKMFETEYHNFYLEKERFRAQTYSYDKIIADKMLSTYRHIEIYNEQLGDNISTIGIIEKISKDFYDLNYVSKKDHSNYIVDYCIKMMRRNFDDLKWKRLEFILTQLQEVNSKILLRRGYNEVGDISKLKELIDLALKA